MDSTVAYLNGDFVPLADAKIGLYDAGLVYGATVFDSIRTFHMKLFRLNDHLVRFRKSCELAGVPQELPDERLQEIATELVERNARSLPDGGELMLVISATPGPVGRYLGKTTDGPPTLAMTTFPVNFATCRSMFTQGARLAVPATRAPLPNVIDPQIKQRSRIHWWIANAQARAIDPHADAPLCDEYGRVTETSSANLLVVRNGEVVRTDVGPVLEGVSMLMVRELCASLGIPFHERSLTVDDCLAADELLVTCTTWCIAGVSALNNRQMQWPGPVLTRLQAAWSEVIGLDFVRQFTH